MKIWKTTPREWLLVLGLVISIPLVMNLVLPRFLSGFLASYVVQPAVWGLLFCLIMRLPRHKGAGKLRMRPALIKLALGIALFQIYLMVIAGFLHNFGRSPNSFTCKGIMINLIFAGTGLIGMEFSRAWLINRLVRKPSAFIPVFIALIYTFICLPLMQIPGHGATLEAVAQFAGSSLLPVFMENLLASFLALWGGALPALVYRGVLQAFNWFCPVLPDLNWAMKALTGIVVPMVGLAIIQEYFFYKYTPGKAKRGAGEGVVSWAVLSSAAVITIWFSLGVFPVRPAVIYSGSMRPTFEVGDVVIVAKRNPRLLKPGDIVSFRMKGSPVPTVHRVIALQNEGGREVFVTKGDANNRPDLDPVRSVQVVGKVVFTIPRVGWASIAIRKLFA